MDITSKNEIRSICDLSDDHPDQVRALRPLLMNFGGLSAFHGPITTIRCFEDNALLKSTLSSPGEGRVMVVDGGGSLDRALFGDQLGALLRDNNWAGVVVHGAVRDIEFIRRMPIGVRAIAACPTRPNKTGSGERDVIVTFCGVKFTPGEWLYADENGIIVSSKSIA